MRKYAFRQGDIVREKTTERKPVIGRVLSCGSSAGHDYYKLESHGEIYNARDDEITLVRRAPNRFEKMGLVDQILLNWYGPDQHPAMKEECLVIWTDYEGTRRVDVSVWKGQGWEMELQPGVKAIIGEEMFDAWTPWTWPGSDGKEDGDDDKSSDSDD